MSGPDPAGSSPGDYAEVALGELVARYVALRLGEDLDPGVGAVPGGDPAERALEQLALGAAIIGRVQAGWALDAVATLRAGGSWEQVAQARGQVVPAVQAELAGWLRAQGPAAPAHRPGPGPGRGGPGVAAARPAPTRRTCGDRHGSSHPGPGRAGPMTDGPVARPSSLGAG